MTGTDTLSLGELLLTCLFRFCDAMIQIRREAEDVITGKQPKDNNVLKNAPHPISVIVLPEDQWNRYVIASALCPDTFTDCPQPIFPSNGRIPGTLAPREEVLAYCVPSR